MNTRSKSVQEYAKEAEELCHRYECLSFHDVHALVLPFLEIAPGDIIDVGAGTGRDAAYFAAKGHRVVAVEPVDEFRIVGSQKHTSSAINWIDDHLPHLASIVAGEQKFDLILLSAVWMHLTLKERCLAMPTIASLLKVKGTVVLSLRHGPVPKTRAMYDVCAEETIKLAEKAGLFLIEKLSRGSIQIENRQAGVTWTYLVFKKIDDQREIRL